MDKMKRFLALFFAKYKFIRKFIGGRWVCDARETKYSTSWVQFNDLKKHKDDISDFEVFQTISHGFVKEDYTK